MDVAGQEVEHAHRVRRDLPSANTDVGQFPSTPFMSTSQRHHHSSDETRMKVSHFQSTFRSQSGNPSTTTTTALGNIPSASDSTYVSLHYEKLNSPFVRIMAGPIQTSIVSARV
ncbi:hypothetical protein K439DRAFT_190224 [Ramaria rubella]|nr:hypothetical protein K439DRAFT_190224 [Ramaria rubella]